MIKMKWRLLGVTLGILVGFLILQLLNDKILFVKEPTTFDTSTSFTTLPIIQFNAANIPCLGVEIEGIKYTLKLDLGHDWELSLNTNLLPKVENKSFQKTVTTYRAKGKPSSHYRYKIPMLKVGPLTFHDLTLDERTEQQNEEIIIHSSIETYSFLPTQGTVGWRLFAKGVLFLDLHNSKIIIADSIETFKKKGPSLQTFNKTSLLTQRNLLECEIVTSRGPLLCVLDTGSTYNLIHSDNPESKSFEKLVKEEENFTTFTTFQIGEKEFGTTTFRPFPIMLPIKVEAILGMDFFSEHQVLIDFKNSEVYFTP